MVPAFSHVKTSLQCPPDRQTNQQTDRPTDQQTTRLLELLKVAKNNWYCWHFPVSMKVSGKSLKSSCLITTSLILPIKSHNFSPETFPGWCNLGLFHYIVKYDCLNLLCGLSCKLNRQSNFANYSDQLVIDNDELYMCS